MEHNLIFYIIISIYIYNYNYIPFLIIIFSRILDYNVGNPEHFRSMEQIGEKK